MSKTGRAILDFGPWPGSAEAVVRVTGLAAVTDTTHVAAWLRAQGTTADHSPDEHAVEQLRVTAGDVVPGVGFSVYGECLNGRAYGQFSVNWAYATNDAVSVTLSQASPPPQARRGEESAGVQVWTPDFLGSAMTAWYRADTVVLNGSTVSQWTDKSGNGRHLAQANANFQPTWVASAVNGQPALDFDGTNDQFTSTDLISSFITASAGTVFAVVVIDAINTNAWPLVAYNNDAIWGDVGGYTGMYLRSTPAIQSFGNDGQNNASESGCTLGAPTSAIYRHAGGRIYTKVNSRSEVSTPMGNIFVMTGALYVGRGWSGQYFDGRILELVFCNSDQSAQYDNWAQYVASRYNIGSWTPANLSGLTCWMRADDVTLNGSTVSQWNDKTGNGRHFTQATPDAQPMLLSSVGALNGRPALDFDGVDDFLASAVDEGNYWGTTDKSFAVVYYYDSIVANASLFGPPASNRFHLTPQSDVTLRNVLFDGSFTHVVDNWDLAPRTAQVVIGRHTGGTAYTAINNQTEVSAAHGSTAFSAQKINLAKYPGPIVHADAKIAEFISASAAWSAQERATLYEYLQQRYGLTPWTPASMTGLTCWLRADTCTTVGVTALVSQWTDKSGSSHHFNQAASINQPQVVAYDTQFNGQPVMWFDGGVYPNHDCFAGPAWGDLVSDTVGTILMVMSLDTGAGTFDTPFGVYNAGGCFMYLPAPNQFQMYQMATNNVQYVTTTLPYTDNTAMKVEWRHDNSTVYGRKGATEVSGTTLGGGGTGNLVTGVATGIGVATGGSNAPPMRVAEMVFLNGLITAQDRVRWDAYVLSRYGI